MELRGHLVILRLKEEQLSVNHHVFNIIRLEDNKFLGTYHMSKPLANERHNIIQSEWIICGDLTDDLYGDIRNIINDHALKMDVQRIYTLVWASNKGHINQLLDHGFCHYNSYGRLNELTDQLETEHVYELKIKN